MKKLNIENASYRYLEESFREWLDIQGYAPTTVYNLPNQIRELFHYLEKQGITNIKSLDSKHIKAYYEKLKERSNDKRSGGLSAAHLNKHIQAIRKFTDYLRKVGRLELAAVPLHNEETQREVTFLTEEEIKQLFAATYLDQEHYHKTKSEALQSRDRAMLSIFYGCGLRRNEGVNLDIGDINFDRSVLHVRKGKNNKERFVPISKTNLQHLQEYIYDYRPLLQRYKTEALFLNYQGTRMQGQSLIIRLKQLQYKTDKVALREKEIGLHTLRHSIATHFLAAGMKLESISQFLGHNSLESTQLYTHLLNEENESNTDNQPFKNIPNYQKTQLADDEWI